jgi:hypothetical protein
MFRQYADRLSRSDIAGGLSRDMDVVFGGSTYQNPRLGVSRPFENTPKFSRFTTAVLFDK